MTQPLTLYSLNITTAHGHKLRSQFYARTQAQAEMITAQVLGSFAPRLKPQRFTLKEYQWNLETRAYNQPQDLTTEPNAPDPLQLTSEG